MNVFYSLFFLSFFFPFSKVVLQFFIFFFYLAAGNKIVMDIMGMMDCYIEDNQRGRLLAQPIHLVIQLAVVLTMLHRSFFSRKTIVHVVVPFLLEWNVLYKLLGLRKHLLSFFTSKCSLTKYLCCLCWFK